MAEIRLSKLLVDLFHRLPLSSTGSAPMSETLTSPLIGPYGDRFNKNLGNEF